MASVKLTKNELKKQKDQLKQFERYLPTLQLKKQQLQMVIMKTVNELEQMDEAYHSMIDALDDWVAVFAENTVFPDDKKIEKLVIPDNVIYTQDNIAGVSVPVFKELTFQEISYDVADYPLWVDEALVQMREIARKNVLLLTMKEQVELLNRELRLTSQRVNLFEKVKIPEAKENIRKIENLSGGSTDKCGCSRKNRKEETTGGRCMIEKMKAVCIVAQDSHKEELLTTLRDLGILHIAEKQAADADVLKRFSMLSHLSLELKDYAKEENGETTTLSDEQFEQMYQNTVRALEQMTMIKEKRTDLVLEAERIKMWGDFDAPMVKRLCDQLICIFTAWKKGNTNGSNRMRTSNGFVFPRLKKWKPLRYSVGWTLLCAQWNL